MSLKSFKVASIWLLTKNLSTAKLARFRLHCLVALAACDILAFSSCKHVIWIPWKETLVALPGLLLSYCHNLVSQEYTLAVAARYKWSKLMSAVSEPFLCPT